MKGFRETFCRPVRRIRFIGLFDTVNSVPQFEVPFLGRKAFPYTAKTSAKLIRHAVSIDERRAKFRVDLIAGNPPEKEKHQQNRPKSHRYLSDLPSMYQPKDQPDSDKKGLPLLKWKLFGASTEGNAKDHEAPAAEGGTTAIEPPATGDRDKFPKRNAAFTPDSNLSASNESLSGKGGTQKSEVPLKRHDLRRRFSDLHDPQDVLEVWFAGNHSDIGGGYRKHRTETWPCAHQALVWMVQEAQKAGLIFDEEKLLALNCTPQKSDANGKPDKKQRERFGAALHASATTGFVHDCLRYHKGSSGVSVAGWKILECLPFRRMDLQPDGSWKAINWPLPRGEVRDIPRDAKIHNSVIERMEKNKKYRPGNLIMLGEGGRGQRVAPKRLGMGEWVSLQNAGDQVNEIFVSKAWADEKDLVAQHGVGRWLHPFSQG